MVNVYCVLACICVALLYSFFSLVMKYSVAFKKKMLISFANKGIV